MDATREMCPSNNTTMPIINMIGVTSAGEVGFTGYHDRPVIFEGSWSWPWSTPKRWRIKFTKNKFCPTWHSAGSGIDNRQNY